MAKTEKNESPATAYTENIDLSNSGAPIGSDLVTLKITRDSWLENKKGILICIMINMVNFEYGLDLGMVNGFQCNGWFLEGLRVSRSSFTWRIWHFHHDATAHH